MSSPAPAPRDPMKGLRGVMAATLVLESITVLLALLVLTKFGDSGGPVGIGLVLGLAVAMIVTAGLLRRPWALWLALGLQLAMIAGGLLVFVLGVLGLIFAAIWLALLRLRRQVAGGLSVSPSN
ncbi:MAG: hypothetical protein JWR88_2256 [Pseudonocardia sp.]|nr:hypothetical protein [Pseudonocardia sp.]